MALDPHPVVNRSGATDIVELGQVRADLDEVALSVAHGTSEDCTVFIRPDAVIELMAGLFAGATVVGEPIGRLRSDGVLVEAHARRRVDKPADNARVRRRRVVDRRLGRVTLVDVPLARQTVVANGLWSTQM